MMPVTVLKTFLTTLVEDLAWDSSSADVRASVLKVNISLYYQMLIFCGISLLAFKPEFIIDIFIHYKLQIAVAILDL